MFRVLKESDRQCNLTEKVEHFFEKQRKQSLAVSVQCQFYKVVNISKIRGKKVATTHKEGVYSSDGTAPADLSPCNHEDGDYIYLLHCTTMSKVNDKAIMFTEDTNVIVIATTFFTS